MDKNDLLKLIPPTATLIFTSLFGLTVGVLVEKFKNRLRIILYSIKTQKIIPPASQFIVGQLQIRIGDLEIRTLKIATIEFENRNNIDLENIIIRFQVGRGAIFQGNDGYLGNATWLFWTTQFNEYYQKVLTDYNQLSVNPTTNVKEPSQELQSRIDYALANRDYIIPVFNRKQKATFNFLIEDPQDGTEADLFPTIVHKSVKLIKATNKDKQTLKDILWSVCIGIVVVILLILLLINQFPADKNIIILSSVIGLSYSITGFLILYTVRRIWTYLS